jgi:Family of unknown function (DUF6247)
MAGMRVIERQFSEFLRQPNQVVAELDEHDVVLRRRNAPALRLSQAERDDDRAEAFEALVRLLRNLAVHSRPALEDSVREVFAWSQFLPTADRQEFVRDLTQTLVASSDFSNFAPVSQLLREWRATAEIHADPRLARRLRGGVDAAGAPVSQPG